MKKLILPFFAVAAFSFVQCGGAEETEEGTGTDSTEVAEEATEEESEGPDFNGEERGDYLLYGYSDVDPASAVTVADMGTAVAEGGFSGAVQVEITEVCQKAGCWMVFNDAEGNGVRVFFRDHFGIPTDTPIGTAAILYGSTKTDTLDVAFQKHLLDDAKEAGEEVSQEDYDAITEDKIETTFDAEAILISKL